MTNQDLLDLLVQLPPEELSIDQLHALRDRLRSDPKFHNLVVNELQMGAYVDNALGRLGTTVNELTPPQPTQRSGRRGVVAAIAFVVALLLLTFGSAAYWEQLRRPQQIAKKPTEEPQQPENDPPPGELADPSVPKLPEPIPSLPDDAEPVPAADDPVPNKAEPQQEQPATEPGVTKPRPPRRARDARLVADENDKPWESLLEVPAEELPSFRDVALESFDFARFVPRGMELRPYFVRPPSEGRELRDVDGRYGRSGQVEGLSKVDVPWLEDSALKFSFENYNRLRLHFFRGLQGLTLVYHEDHSSRWLAYATTREEGKLKPASYTLTSCDDFRNARTEIWHGGTYQLRYHDREIILSRGDIVLLRAPFDGPPEESYLEGKATVYGIELIRTTDFLAAPAPLPLVENIPAPADWQWIRKQEKCPEPQKLPDGSLRFAADSPLEERCQLYAHLPPGFQEVELQLTDVTPGATLCITRRNGSPMQSVRFMKNPATKELQLQNRGWDDEINGEDRKPWERPTASVAADTCWVKLTYGLGFLSWRVSVDGVHWGGVEVPAAVHPGDAPTLGLELVARQPCGMTIKQIRVRKLNAFSELVESELQDRAVSFIETQDFKQWQEKIAAQRPEDISELDWQCGCAIRSLEAGAPQPLSGRLAELLIEHGLARKLPVEKIIAALDLFGQLSTHYHSKQLLQTGLLQRYCDLPRHYPTVSFADMWQHWQEIPLNTDWFDRLGQVPTFTTALRQELLERLTLHPGPETARFVQRARFFHLDQYEPLVLWAHYQAQRSIGQSATSAGEQRVRDTWHHPFVEELSKETYNLVSELEAVLASDAADDAARLITRVDFAEHAGLTPSKSDPRLLTSAQVAVGTMLAEHPLLAQSLSQRFESLSALRQQAAEGANDAPAMQQIAYQFAGTSGSAAALKWLGDRALVEGWFETAVDYYVQAQKDASAGLRQEILPRLRLAGALAGKELGSPATENVVVGNVVYSAAEFEKMVLELREQATTSEVGIQVLTAAEPLANVPLPRKFKAEVRDPFEGAAGDRPNEEGARHVNHFKIDWVARQMGAAIEGNRLYLSNRFQLSAYDLTNGQRKWRAEPQGLQKQRSQTRPLIAARPLILGDRILVRHCYGNNFGLMLVAKEDGKVLWQNGASESKPIISDPFLIQGQVVILTGTTDMQEFRLNWTVIDPQTGIVERQFELARLKLSWLQRPSAEVRVNHDGVIIQLAGCVLACDAAGEVRWLRHTVYTPDEEDKQWVLQHYQRPVVEGNRLFVAQPGVRAVECLERDTGRSVWCRVLANVTGILGVDEDRLVITTEDGLAALDARTGEFLWRQTIEESHPAWALGDGTILSLERERVEPGKDLRRNLLVWRDMANGELLRSVALDGLDRNDPRLGLLIPHQDRLWTLFGEGQQDTNRRLIELVPVD